MSSLIKSLKFHSLYSRNNGVLLNSIRHHWNKDFKPLPYPKTEAEALSAAEKYNVHPSEYKPYPDDGTGAGDYPALPLESGDSRDPFYPWDNPELKRNFNEPLHVDFDLIREDRYDVNAKLRYPLWLMFTKFIGTLLGFFLIYHFCERYKMFHPLVPKQYPQKGKVHYTFERQ